MRVTKRKGGLAKDGKNGSKPTVTEDDDFDSFVVEPSSLSNKYSFSKSYDVRLIIASIACLLSLLTWLLFPNQKPSPYAIIMGAVDDRFVQQALQLGQQVVESGVVQQKRAFGTGQQYLSQHSIVYLHGPASYSTVKGEIINSLRHVAEAAAKKQQWSLGSLPLVPRCVELIKYTSSSGSNASESIGWHDDGATLITVAILIDERSSYAGGDIEVVDDAGIVSRVAPNRLDAVAWRGWHRHRVLPITRGERNVLVGEFWSQRLGQPWDAMDDRPLDDMRRYQDALKIDPTSSALHEGLGVLAAKLDDPELAERSFRSALSLNPFHASAAIGLGVVVQREDKLGAAMAAMGMAGMRKPSSSVISPRAAEAEHAFLHAMQLDPTTPAAPYDLSLLYERVGRNSEAQSYREIALNLDPSILDDRRRAGQSAASQLHS